MRLICFILTECAEVLPSELKECAIKFIKGEVSRSAVTGSLYSINIDDTDGILIQLFNKTP